jgi:Skp family chaperone for outer membrane proteins
MIRAICLAWISLFALCSSVHAEDFLISDSRDAFTRVQAMKSLLDAVSSRIQTIQKSYEQQAAPIQTELQAARKQASTPATQKRKAELLRQLINLQEQAASAQKAVGIANEKALAEVESQISAIEAELKRERGAKAVLRAQDTLYFNPACTCNITEELYKRINARVTQIALQLP